MGFLGETANTPFAALIEKQVPKTVTNATNSFFIIPFLWLFDDTKIQLFSFYANVFVGKYINKEQHLTYFRPNILFFNVLFIPIYI
jgi:hypothetical protein